MYSNIVDPKTGKPTPTLGPLGKQVIQRYTKYFSGIGLKSAGTDSERATALVAKFSTPELAPFLNRNNMTPEEAAVAEVLRYPFPIVEKTSPGLEESLVLTGEEVALPEGWTRHAIPDITPEHTARGLDHFFQHPSLGSQWEHPAACTIPTITLKQLDNWRTTEPELNSYAFMARSINEYDVFTVENGQVTSRITAEGQTIEFIGKPVNGFPLIYVGAEGAAGGDEFIEQPAESGWWYRKLTPDEIAAQSPRKYILGREEVCHSMLMLHPSMSLSVQPYLGALSRLIASVRDKWIQDNYTQRAGAPGVPMVTPYRALSWVDRGGTGSIGSGHSVINTRLTFKPMNPKGQNIMWYFSNREYQYKDNRELALLAAQKEAAATSFYKLHIVCAARYTMYVLRKIIEYFQVNNGVQTGFQSFKVVWNQPQVAYQDRPRSPLPTARPIIEQIPGLVRSPLPANPTRGWSALDGYMADPGSSGSARGNIVLYPETGLGIKMFRPYMDKFINWWLTNVEGDDMPVELPRGHRMDFNERLTKTILISYGSCSAHRFTWLEKQRKPFGPQLTSGEHAKSVWKYRMSPPLKTILKGHCKLKSYIENLPHDDIELANAANARALQLKRCAKNNYNIDNMNLYCSTPDIDTPTTTKTLRAAHAWLQNNERHRCMGDDDQYSPLGGLSECEQVIEENTGLRGFTDFEFDDSAFSEGLFESDLSGPCTPGHGGRQGLVDSHILDERNTAYLRRVRAATDADEEMGDDHL